MRARPPTGCIVLAQVLSPGPADGSLGSSGFTLSAWHWTGQLWLRPGANGGANRGIDSVGLLVVHSAKRFA